MVSTSFASVASPTWHDPTDVQVRKLMMARLRTHSALGRQHPILQTHDETGTSPSLLQRLEWMLYHSAGSLSEYLHQPSLERRVQGLVTHYKRKRSATEPPHEDGIASLCASLAKRQRVKVTLPDDEQLEDSWTISATGCVLHSNLDLLHHVCRFLDSFEILRCRSVNKFLYLHAPSFVRSLHMDATSAPVLVTRHRSDGTVTGLHALLHECKNLTSLTISNQANQAHVKAGIVFPRALTASKGLHSLASASYGHQLVCEVASALEGGACLSLQTLELLAPFDFATESTAVLMVLRALTESNTEHGVRSPLQHLVLDATFLGDSGIEQLTDLFETRCAFFKHLQTLVVRNNFMGETGCRALLEAIEPFSDLQTLDLSRNILTDTDALALADLLDDPVADWSYCDNLDGDWMASSGEHNTEREQLSAPGLAGLRILKLHENFITCDGFYAITIALCSREVFVATIGNAVESDDEEDDEQDDEDEDDDDSGDEELMDGDQEH